MIVCPQAGCASPNVVDLPHYWLSLPSESPLKVRYAPPPGVAGSYWTSVGVVAVGLLIAASGMVGLGLLLIAGGVVWGGLLYRFTAQAATQKTAWESEQVCLACTHRF